MTAFAQLRLVRAILAAGVTVRAVAWGFATASTLFVGAAIVDMIVPVSFAARSVLFLVAILSAIVVAVAACWRDRTVLSIERVALWVEEHFPSLEYVLVTAIETGNDTLVQPAQTGAWTSTAGQRATRAQRAPLLALVATFAILLALPGGAVARIRSPRAGDSLDRAGRGVSRANRLAPLVAEVVPPAYSGEQPKAIDEPTDIRTLQGSDVTLRGRGDAVGVVARIGGDSVLAVRHGDRWAITMRVGSRPVAVRLEDGAHRRIIGVEPIVDNAPAVNLITPARDSVLRAPSGRLALFANVNDDFGIANASFEYIVSSGEGETFTFKSGTLGVIRPNARTASMSASLPLEALSLKPGDIVHVRAIARDANNVTGPGVGASETRAIRIARPDEYDSVAVDAAAPSEADRSVISERMLILLAEALQKKRRSLTREALLGESHGIATDQKKLRRSVGDVVFTRLGGNPSGEERTDEDSPRKAKTMEELLARADSATNRSTDAIDFEGGESPVVAVNKPLLEAYNAMWDASLHLELGEPDKALPFMRRALEAIQRARKAERLYLRGAPPRVVIDIAKARLKGKDKGSSSTRRGLTAADSIVRSRTDRFTRVVGLSAANPAAAIDSLLMLRIDALGESPVFARALSDAAAAMRRGDGTAATAALARARRALAGSPVALDSLGRWGIVP